MDELTGCVMQQPIFVVLINPRALGYFEGRRPHSKRQTVATHSICNVAHTAGEQTRIGRSVFAARVLISLVNLKILVAAFFEILSQPLRIGNRGPLVEPKIISRPTPPSNRSWRVDASLVQ